MKKVIICISTIGVAVLGFFGIKKLIKKETEYIETESYEDVSF